MTDDNFDVTKKTAQFWNEARQLGLDPDTKVKVFDSFIDGTFDSVKDAVSAMKSGDLPGQAGEFLKENTRRSLAGEPTLPPPQRNLGDELNQGLRSALGMNNKTIEVTLPDAKGNL